MKTNKLLSLVLAFVICFAAPLTVNPLKAFAADETTAVAKVGNTEYATIDEAIANWTNNTTLTLLADVTLSDTIQVSSTEYRILDLSTFTMTAASKKDAIQIVANGRSSASYALDIKADANNPGGITATGKAVVKSTGKSGLKDRPIIRFYGGVLTGTNVAYHSGSNGTNCTQFWFYGGEFNGTVYANRALINIYGGTFNGSLQCSVDSSAYMLIAGGRFKQLSNAYGSSLNSSKFTIGSAKGVYDRYIYVDAEGYVNVVKQLPENIASEAVAVVNAAYNTNHFFAYSAMKNADLYYGNLESVISMNSNYTIKFLETSNEPLSLSGTLRFDVSNGGVVPAEVINFTSTSSKLVVTFKEGSEPNIQVNPYESRDYDPIISPVNNGNGTVTWTYSMKRKPTVAKANGISYCYLEDAIAGAYEGQTVTLMANVETSNLTIDKSITFDLNGKTLTLNQANARAAGSGLTLAEGKDITIKNGKITGVTEAALIQNSSNLTLINVTLDAGETGLALSNIAGKAIINNSDVQGLIELTDGDLTTIKADQSEVTYTVPGKYVQIEEESAEEIVRLDDYKFDIAVTKNALKTGETLTATISLDKDFYSTEFTFTYNKDLFECSADTDGDGVIYMILFSKEGADYQSLATFELKALNTINNVTSTDLEVSGNVIQYKEQAINQYVNEAEGDKEVISISLNYEVEIYADYVSGYSLVLVYGADGGYAYNGSAMFYMKDYGAYAFIVEGGVSPAGVDAVISKASGCKEIKISYDVNCEFVADGKVDLKDATIAYACTSLDFDVVEYMELYLRANVINDEEGKINVNSADINAIIAYYNSL